MISSTLLRTVSHTASRSAAVLAAALAVAAGGMLPALAASTLQGADQVALASAIQIEPLNRVPGTCTARRCR